MTGKKQQNEEMTPMGCAFTFAFIGCILLFSGIKVWGLLAIVVGGVIAWLSYKTAKYEKSRARKNYNPVKVSVSVDDNDEYEYSIKGINYCGIDDSMLGDFEGTARALRSNTHDPYAIGIYRGNKRVGFLPRGNKELHARIMANGGSAGAMGYIAKAEEDGHTFYYGKVNIMGI